MYVQFVMQNSAISLAVNAAVYNNYCTYLWRDGQAEFASVAGNSLQLPSVPRRSSLI